MSNDQQLVEQRVRDIHKACRHYKNHNQMLGRKKLDTMELI